MPISSSTGRLLQRNRPQAISRLRYPPPDRVQQQRHERPPLSPATASIATFIPPTNAATSANTSGPQQQRYYTHLQSPLPLGEGHLQSREIPSRAPRLAAVATCRCASFASRTTFVHGLQTHQNKSASSHRGWSSIHSRPHFHTLLSRSKRGGSFVPQRRCRVHARCTPCRQVSGQACDQGQRCRGSNHGYRIVRRDAVELRLD